MDLFGQVLQDYHQGVLESKLWLHNSYGHPEDMPVDIFFREENEMPELELVALSSCRGKILDIGAGVGSHALALQKRSANITAMEISSLACEIMRSRGVKEVITGDILHYSGSKFDTLLLLMNGIGLCGDLDGLLKFLDRAKTWLNPGGTLIFDSSDISYLYEDVALPDGKYYGEISYQYEYKGQFGDWFNWLYIDSALLAKTAKEKGWEMELLFEDDMDQYLVRLKRS